MYSSAPMIALLGFLETTLEYVQCMTHLRRRNKSNVSPCSLLPVQESVPLNVTLHMIGYTYLGGVNHKLRDAHRDRHRDGDRRTYGHAKSRQTDERDHAENNTFLHL